VNSFILNEATYQSRSAWNTGGPGYFATKLPIVKIQHKTQNTNRNRGR